MAKQTPESLVAFIEARIITDLADAALELVAADMPRQIYFRSIALAEQDFKRLWRGGAYFHV